MENHFLRTMRYLCSSVKRRLPSPVMILGGEKAPHHGWSLLRHTVTSFPSSLAFLKRTRELFKEIRDAKGTFHAKMGSIKDRNGRDPTEAEDIKKRWQEYTEELYKNDLHYPDNHDGLITHLEPDNLDRSQVGLRKHYYKHKLVEVMEFQMRYFKS